MIPLMVFVVAIAAIAVMFEHFIISRDRRADVEDGQTPLYSEICAARIGAQNWSVPFVRVTLYPAFAVVSYAKTIILPYEVIDHVVVERFLLGRGVRIYHHHLDTPEQLVIWSLDNYAFHAKLSALVGSYGTPRALA